jgi:hypothetical protein
MLCMLFNSNTTGVTFGAGTAKPFRAHESTPAFSGIRVARSFDFYVMFCGLVCPFVPVRLAIVLYVLLLLTASDYPFCIFKLSFL